MLGFRRVVYRLQWVAVFAIPIVTVLCSSGWEAFISLPAAVLGLLAMFTTAIISTVSRDLRAVRAVPPTYAVLSVVLWIVALVFPLALEHSGDSGITPSILETLGLQMNLDPDILLLSGVLSVGLWIGTLVALLGRVRTPAATAPTVPTEPSASGEAVG